MAQQARKETPLLGEQKRGRGRKPKWMSQIRDVVEHWLSLIPIIRIHTRLYKEADAHEDENRDIAASFAASLPAMVCADCQGAMEQAKKSILAALNQSRIWDEHTDYSVGQISELNERAHGYGVETLERLEAMRR